MTYLRAIANEFVLLPALPAPVISLAALATVTPSCWPPRGWLRKATAVTPAAEGPVTHALVALAVAPNVMLPGEVPTIALANTTGSSRVGPGAAQAALGFKTTG